MITWIQHQLSNLLDKVGLGIVLDYWEDCRDCCCNHSVEPLSDDDNEDWVPTRPGHPRFEQLSVEEQNNKINEIRNKQIEELAYHKWEKAGRPEGMSEQFWAEAVNELCNEDL